MLAEIQQAFESASATGQETAPRAPEIAGEGDLPSWFETTKLAAASVAMAGMTLSNYLTLSDGMAKGRQPAVTVDRRLASFWFKLSLRPDGWTPPDLWDAVAGDYPAKDGWIRLHTNAAAHRAAALKVLGCGEDREAVARAVREWTASELEAAVVAAGGCAAEMRSLEAWQAHSQGAAAAREPLVIW